MNILRNLSYFGLFVSSLVFNLSFADDIKPHTQKIDIEFIADLHPITCDGVEITPSIDFGSFSVDELRQGSVQPQKLFVRLNCDQYISKIDGVVVVIRPGAHGFLDDSTLLTSKDGVGIKLISSKYGVVISETANPEPTFDLEDDKFEEVIEFKPIYLGGEVTLGEFEAFATVEIRYM